MIKYPKINNFGGANVQQPLPGENMVKNNAGGYVYKISDMEEVKRFCIIGTMNGTFYISETKHTTNNTNKIIDLIKNGKGNNVYDVAMNVIINNLAYKIDHSLFVLALCATYGDIKLRSKVFNSLSIFCNIPTHLFMFVNYVKSMRGVGRSLKRNISNWYNNKKFDLLMYHVLKYQNREGLTHKNMILCAHPKTNDVNKNKLFRYILDVDNLSKLYDKDRVIESIYSYNNDVNPKNYLTIKNLSKLDDEKDIIEAIKKFKLVRENIPTKFLNNKNVFIELIKNMPYTALIRNLGKMSVIGILNNFSENNLESFVCDKITDEKAIKLSMVHPMQLYLALTTYSSGRGFKGNLSWEINQKVVEALTKAMEISFKFTKNLKKNIVVAVDVSGSMETFIPDTKITCSQYGAMLSYIFTRTVENCKLLWFNTDCRILNNSSNTFESITKAYKKVSGGGTNLKSPVKYVYDMIESNYKIDGLVIVTDNEGWFGGHPTVTLNDIRKIQPDFKLVTLSTVATPYSTFRTHDNDFNNLDIVGFSSDCISIVGRFLNGEF